jgi:uncharacterized membrane protein YhhN
MIKSTTYLYFGVGAVNLAAQLMGWAELNIFTKPLLMPILILYVFVYSAGVISLPRLLLALALIFSWIGDVILLWQGEELYFLMGLGAFLVAQVLYAITLNKASNIKLKFELKPLIPLLLYAGLLLFALVKNSGQMAPAIVVYGICIITMLAIARLRRWATNTESYRLAFYGAFFFVISDSVLALNKFVFDIPAASFFVMGTYIVAQYYLMKGILEHPA